MPRPPGLKSSEMPSLLEAAVAEENLDRAFAWLCAQRKEYSPNSDIWDFRRGWPDAKDAYVAEVLSGDYLFSPVNRYSVWYS